MSPRPNPYEPPKSEGRRLRPARKAAVDAATVVAVLAILLLLSFILPILFPAPLPGNL